MGRGRFECKVFLTDAARYFEGLCARCMIDNTHVVVLAGTGRDMTAVPEMTEPLPIHVPDVYLRHHRIVDTEGFVNVQRVRYSVPWKLISRRLEARETKDRVEIFDGPRLVASHRRPLDPADQRVIEPAHRPPRGAGVFARDAMTPEHKRLIERAPAFVQYITLLKSRGRGSLRDIRTLLRMLDEYPPDALLAAIEEATRFGMTDLDRLDRMVLQRIARDFFPPPPHPPDDNDPEDNDD